MLKKLKSIFIVEEKGSATGPASAKSSKPGNPTASNTRSKPASGTSDKASADPPDSKFVNLLLKAIEANNREGFDYLEFKQSLQSLEKVESDEAKRYKSAFVMAQTMGLERKTLFESAQHYANVLGQEEKKFNDAVENQRTAKIAAKKNKLTKLNNSIANKETEIKKLMADIETEKKDLVSVKSEIDSSLAKVESTKDAFYKAYNMVLDQIKTDMDLIDKYI